MGQCIIRQPNGLLAVWSTIVDDFVMMDATVDDIVADRVRRATSRALADVRDDMQHVLEHGTSSRVGRTWDVALDQLRDADDRPDRVAAGTKEAPKYLLRRLKDGG